MILTDEQSRALLDQHCDADCPACAELVRATERAVMEQLAEPLIRACLPGGDVCDPQQVADAIREYFAALRGDA